MPSLRYTRAEDVFTPSVAEVLCKPERATLDSPQIVARLSDVTGEKHEVH
jgi:hypothetical protein